MAEIVNLRQHRKRKARASGEAVAAENRLRFGMTRAEREREAAVQAQDERKLDGHRRETPGDEEQ
jgi:Domain of unknown function (DUF4169)